MTSPSCSSVRNSVFRSVKCFFFGFSLLMICNEFLIYYVTLMQCRWPEHNRTEPPLKALFLADTHLLGPFRGHPWDKLRREWQMSRAFQTALTLFDPEVVFLLGDVFDEGQWVDQKGWEEYLRRFHSIFARDPSVPLVVVPGNHDIGFHYHLLKNPEFVSRFKQVFDTGDKQVSTLTIKGVNFVLMNSMAFEKDNCSLCKRAERELFGVSRDLQCARGGGQNCPSSSSSLSAAAPILLQHFPLYRRSDAECEAPDDEAEQADYADTAPPSEAAVPFRPKWDCVSEASTRQILSLLSPRLVFSGHTHHGCLVHHKAPSRLSSSHLLTSDGIPEFSVSSFSWRNRNNPTFLLAALAPSSHDLTKCFLPEESTVINLYIFGVGCLFFYLVLPWRRCFLFVWCRRERTAETPKCCDQKLSDDEDQKYD